HGTRRRNADALSRQLADAVGQAADAGGRGEYPGCGDARRVRIRSGVQSRVQAFDGLTAGGVEEGSDPASVKCCEGSGPSPRLFAAVSAISVDDRQVELAQPLRIAD